MEQVRITVTLDQQVAAELRRSAGSRGMSAFVNDAVLRRLQAVRIQKMLDEMDEEFGPVPLDVQQEVDALFCSFDTQRTNDRIHRVAAVEPPSGSGWSATSMQCFVRRSIGSTGLRLNLD